VGVCPAWPGHGQRKKLIEAGYVHAKQSASGVDGLAEDAEFISGLPPEWLKRHKADFLIHDECWEAWELYQFCGTQWRVAPMGGRVGLDYAAVVAVAQFRGCKPDVMEQVRYLEMGALIAYANKDLEAVLDD